MDVVATMEAVAILHSLFVKSTTMPAPAVNTGGVSGSANVMLAAAAANARSSSTASCAGQHCSNSIHLS